MFALALKEIRFFKVKYTLIGFILFLIAALVFIVSGLARGLAFDTAVAMEEMDAERFYLETDADEQLVRSRFMLSDLEEEIDREAGWEPLLLHRIRLDLVDSDFRENVTLVPVDPDRFVYPGVVTGESIDSSTDLHIVVDESLQADGVEVGDQLYNEESDLQLTVVGFAENQMYSHMPLAYIAEDAFASMEIVPESVANAILLQESDEELEARIENIVSGGNWLTKDAVVQATPGYSAQQSSLMMMIAFLIIIAVFVLASFFYIITIQKINQFGVLKAIGAKNSFLVGATVLQVFSLAVISIGVAIAFTVFVQMNLPPGMPFVFDLSLLFVYSGILLTVSLLGALLSSVKIVKVDPQQAMGRAE